MGYSMNQGDSEFFIKAEDKPKVVEAVKKLIGHETCGDYFSWVDDFSDLDTAEEILAEWRWDVGVDDDGNIIELYFTGEKLGDDEILFNAIAEFVKEESYITMHGKNGDMWRWFFEHNMCIEQTPNITWG